MQNPVFWCISGVQSSQNCVMKIMFFSLFQEENKSEFIIVEKFFFIYNRKLSHRPISFVSGLIRTLIKIKWDFQWKYNTSTYPLLFNQTVIQRRYCMQWNVNKYQTESELKRRLLQLFVSNLSCLMELARKCLLLLVS